MRKINLESDRLILRTLPPSYAGKVLKFYQDNKSFLEQYEPERKPYFYTKQHQRQLLKWDLEGLHHLSMIRFWLFKKSQPEIPIGTIAISNITRGAFQSCFVGYKIAESHARQGYMTEALFKTIEYTFNNLKLHRIEANIMPRNNASLNLVNKFGFHEEGLALRYLNIDGKWEDHIHMVLLNE